MDTSLVSRSSPQAPAGEGAAGTGDRKQSPGVPSCGAGAAGDREAAAPPHPRPPLAWVGPRGNPLSAKDSNVKDAACGRAEGPWVSPLLELCGKLSLNTGVVPGFPAAPAGRAAALLGALLPHPPALAGTPRGAGHEKGQGGRRETPVLSSISFPLLGGRWEASGGDPTAAGIPGGSPCPAPCAAAKMLLPFQNCLLILPSSTFSFDSDSLISHARLHLPAGDLAVPMQPWARPTPRGLAPLHHCLKRALKIRSGKIF